MSDIFGKTDKQIDAILSSCSSEERDQWRNLAWEIDAWFMDQEYSKLDPSNIFHSIDVDENKVYFEGVK
jgi:hypothetical protein|tara:strand:- start:365 stop:571 length:207 start_codon:yes stop_codon:yes gene_type:complete